MSGIREMRRLQAFCDCGATEMYDGYMKTDLPEGWTLQTTQYAKQYGWAYDTIVRCPTCTANPPVEEEEEA